MKLRRAELKKARIEIIPMIDTIFFLLVFFMITSLAKVQMSAKRVDLPQSSTAQGKPIEKVVVTLTSSGDYYVDREEVDFSSILGRLQERVAENPNVTVVLNCDRSQSVEEFLRIMDTAKLANPGELMIATAPKTPGK
jgi:biopolymer transport protein ExbD